MYAYGDQIMGLVYKSRMCIYSSKCSFSYAQIMHDLLDLHPSSHRKIMTGYSLL